MNAKIPQESANEARRSASSYSSGQLHVTKDTPRFVAMFGDGGVLL